MQIYVETSSLQQENVPKLLGVLRLLLRKSGHWPVHDITEKLCYWHISELIVVNRANDISDKKKKTLCETIPSPNGITKQVGGRF